jgi:hypothetical protein
LRFLAVELDRDLGLTLRRIFFFGWDASDGSLFDFRGRTAPLDDLPSLRTIPAGVAISGTDGTVATDGDSGPAGFDPSHGVVMPANAGPDIKPHPYQYLTL